MPDLGRDATALQLRNAALRSAGESLFELPGRDPLFMWLHGSTLVEARPGAEGVWHVQAWLVLGATLEQGRGPLLERIAASLPYGRIVIDDEGDVTLAHSITADRGPAEQARELLELCRHADRIDDLLSEHLGGMRSLDRLDAEIQSLVVSLLHPPADA
jgi:hypothetical protein